MNNILFIKVKQKKFLMKGSLKKNHKRRVLVNIDVLFAKQKNGFFLFNMKLLRFFFFLFFFFASSTFFSLLLTK